MPENGKNDESGIEFPLNVDCGSENDDVEEKIMHSTNQESKKKTRAEKDIDWGSKRTRYSNSNKKEQNKHWKEQVGDTLQPGNYNILLREQEIEAAHARIKEIFDDITEYHIWRTSTVRAGYKQRRSGNGDYNLQVYIRTSEPTPVAELPDRPRPRKW